MIYERIGLSKKPEAVIKMQISQLQSTDKITPEMTFKEPYFLEFIGAHNYTTEQLKTTQNFKTTELML